LSGSGTISAVIPAPSSPLVDGQRNITVPWRAYLLVLQRRTGGTAGVSTSDNTKLVAAERNARINADQALQAAIDAADAAWRTAVDAEEAARIAGDQYLNTVFTGTSNLLQAEIVRATTAEALLVPTDQLCTLWSQCDLGFLPTTDPGGNRPWLDGTHVVVGTSAIVPYALTIEDGTGHWTLEGDGDWDWG
jgi:hypothetical protein